MDYIYRYDSPLGGITMAGCGAALSGLWFDGQQHFAATLSPGFVERDLPVFQETKRWLDLYFSGTDPGFTPLLMPRGTVFRRQVWNTLLTIPYGRTVTYGELADRIARQAVLSRISARAVGNAVGHNPVSLIIPCHRVIGAGGCLTGYAGGIEKKEWLLRMEQKCLSKDCP